MQVSLQKNTAHNSTHLSAEAEHTGQGRISRKYRAPQWGPKGNEAQNRNYRKAQHFAELTLKCKVALAIVPTSAVEVSAVKCHKST